MRVKREPIMKERLIAVTDAITEAASKFPPEISVTEVAAMMTFIATLYEMEAMAGDICSASYYALVDIDAMMNGGESAPDGTKLN